jgi:sulfur-oxidizing protein SoxX
MKISTVLIGLGTVVSLGGCAVAATDKGADIGQQALALMKSSFQDRGQATVDRLVQDDVQRICSEPDDGSQARKDKLAAIEKAELAAVKPPSDGTYLGDFVAGEKVAQTGVGFQWSDKPGAPAGGNCYACHQMSKKEISFGNMGPSLYNYGKLRGDSAPIMEYTWNKLQNAKAYNACSTMPRFGHKGILTETQIKDVMALLLDPKSPVNQ